MADGCNQLKISDYEKDNCKDICSPFSGGCFCQLPEG